MSLKEKRMSKENKMREEIKSMNDGTLKNRIEVGENKLLRLKNKSKISSSSLLGVWAGVIGADIAVSVAGNKYNIDELTNMGFICTCVAIGLGLANLVVSGIFRHVEKRTGKIQRELERELLNRKIANLSSWKEKSEDCLENGAETYEK